jgi:ABC-2 type transport system permease protein
MSELAGAGTLAAFIVRRDRLRLAIWIVVIAGLVVVTASSVEGLYPTAADLRAAAAAVHGNAAVIALNGPAQGLETLGGRIAFETGSFGLLLAGLMSALTAGRLTRGEEESGRMELLQATAVGRHAPAAAAVIVVAALNVVLGAAIALALLAYSLPATGSLVFGASFAVLGCVVAAATLVVAQVVEGTRVVYGVAGALLGAAFVLRAIGDAGDGTLSWLSPIGWAQASRPFAGERWWPLLLALVAAGALLAAAAALAARRDHGAGLVPPRPGPPGAPVSLSGPLGLALRLQRGTLAAWVAGLLALGASYGSVAGDVDEIVGDNETLRDVIARAGGPDLTDAFLGTALLMLALIGASYAIQSTQRLRGEEAAGLAEPVLATAASRRRWASGHLALAFGGSAAVLAAGGLGLGAAYAVASGDAAEVPRMLGAALLYAPALWALAGLCAAIFGLAPRAVAAAWAALGFCFAAGLLQELLSLPGWLTWLSPFRHIPELPAAEPTALGPAVVALAALALTAVGVRALERRDVG